MRRLGLLLALAAWAEPTATHLQGRVWLTPLVPVGREPKPQSVRVQGTFFQGEVSFGNEMDLRDCRQMRLRVKLRNSSRTPARFSLSVAFI